MTDASDRPIAIICPMAREMRPYIQPLALTPAEPMGNWKVSRGRGPGGRIVAAVSGCGLANTAAVTAGLLTRYQPLLVLHSGCCGGHGDDLLPGDLVIGAHAVEVGTGRAGADGAIDPTIPDFFHKVDRGKREKQRLIAPANLVATAELAWRQSPLLHKPWPLKESWPTDQPVREAECVSGTLGSQDRWTSDPDAIRELRAIYGQDTEDCESSAFMQIATTLGIPALAVRCVCNNDLHLALPFGSKALDVAIDEAARRAAGLILAMLAHLADRADNE